MGEDEEEKWSNQKANDWLMGKRPNSRKKEIWWRDR